MQVTPPNAVKADADGASTPGQAAHDHSQVTANAQPAPTVADANAQLATLPQQQLSGVTPAAATDKFTVTHAAGAAVPLSGLAVEIAASVQSGKTRFDVRLDPADLGRIDVRIDVDRNGQVTSHLTVEKPETLSMLQQDAPQLQQALNDAGLKTGNGGLQFSLRDQSSSGQNNGEQQPDRRQCRSGWWSARTTRVPAAVAGRSYGRMLGNERRRRHQGLRRLTWQRQAQPRRPRSSPAPRRRRSHRHSSSSEPRWARRPTRRIAGNFQTFLTAADHAAAEPEPARSARHQPVHPAAGAVRRRRAAAQDQRLSSSTLVSLQQTDAGDPGARVRRQDRGGRRQHHGADQLARRPGS